MASPSNVARRYALGSDLAAPAGVDAERKVEAILPQDAFSSTIETRQSPITPSDQAAAGHDWNATLSRESRIHQAQRMAAQQRVQAELHRQLTLQEEHHRLMMAHGRVPEQTEAQGSAPALPNAQFNALIYGQKAVIEARMAAARKGAMERANAVAQAATTPVNTVPPPVIGSLKQVQEAYLDSLRRTGCFSRDEPLVHRPRRHESPTDLASAPASTNQQTTPASDLGSDKNTTVQHSTHPRSQWPSWFEAQGVDLRSARTLAHGSATNMEQKTQVVDHAQPVTQESAAPRQLDTPLPQAGSVPKGTQAHETEKAAARPHHPASATAAYLDHSSAARVSTDTVIARALKAQYPSLDLTIAEQFNCQLLSYAAAGNAIVEPIDDSDAQLASLSWKVYAPPARRLDGGNGALGELPIFGKYMYRWSGHEFIVYLFDGRDGLASYPQIRNFYILAPKKELADRLIMAAGKWSDELQEEILVFDQGNWTKSKELYASVRQARWEDVILDDSMKKAVIDDHLSFFRSRDTYTGLKVPWKRGVIYYGPPGNGKTISIKATMNMLYQQTPQIPTLYVRTLSSWMGPEYSIRMIFAYARRYAPCYLVFEDLDTIVSDSVRSYFLNEVDGLKNNDGIFMVGSTNHLDRLDPGISKRPSRFDRKYFFPDPNLEQRVAYCHFWQKKLGKNDDVQFPDKLCKPIAEITDKFSFAYMQEAFVATLLAIARKSDDQSHGAVSPQHGGDSDNEWVGVDAHDDFDTVSDDGDSDSDDDDLDKYVLWVEIQKQVAILREGIEEES